MVAIATGADANPRKPAKLEIDDTVPLASGINSTTNVLLEVIVKWRKPLITDNKMKYDQYEFAKVNRNMGGSIMRNPKPIVFLLPILSST